MRLRITVRGTDVELRGYVDGMANARLLSQQMEGIGVVAASVADDDYDPFKEQELRELHHFETEEKNERLANELAQANNNHADLARKYRQRQQFIEQIREDYKALQAQFAEPPEGWHIVGTHINSPGVPLEFWGMHAGIPLWERPKQ